MKNAKAQVAVSLSASLQSKVITRAKLPAVDSSLSNSLVIYDRKLIRAFPALKKWLQHCGQIYPVTAGEQLKSIETFPHHITKLLKKADQLSRDKLQVVAIGGGSVLDFAGFIASTLKRGVQFVSIPSTWLAAVDAAHGGKTALNVAAIKNQLGTFYNAKKIYLLKDLLFAQPEKLANQAFAELLKISLIDGGAWARSLHSSHLKGAKLMWKYLPSAIAAKYCVVKKDPYEKNGHRQILNLGHTVGHVLESFYNCSHGQAVCHGLDFAIKWSVQKKMLAPSEALTYQELLKLDKFPTKIPTAKFLHLLKADKKSVGANRVSFVFLSGLGSPVCKRVQLNSLVAEARRQEIVE